MTARVKLLKELVSDELYVIDHAAVADALLVRCSARRVLPAVTFPAAAAPGTLVRSFRPHRGTRSFRLTRGSRRTLLRRSIEQRSAA